MCSYTPSLLQSYKSDLDDEIDEGFWFRCNCNLDCVIESDSRYNR
jgi:hypothetical protein